ncbi:unnamed protein product [Closterium sp. NIES-53]
MTYEEEQRKGAIVEALTHFSVLSANAMATGVTTTRMRLQLMKKYSQVQDVNPSEPPTIHPDLLHYIVTHDPRLSPSPSTRPSTSSPPNASSPPLSPSSSASPPNTPPPHSPTHSRSLADGRTRGRMGGEEGEVEEEGRREEEGGGEREEGTDGGGEGEGGVEEGLLVGSDMEIDGMVVEEGDGEGGRLGREDEDDEEEEAMGWGGTIRRSRSNPLL